MCTRILAVMSLHWHMLRGKCGASEAIYARPLSRHLDLKQKKDAVALHSVCFMIHEVHSFSLGILLAGAQGLERL